VEMGLIQSFARPGDNITGVVNLEVDLGPKRLEMFRDLVPGLHRILFPYDPTDASSVAAVRGYREAARRLGLVLVEQTVQTQAEAQAMLTQSARTRWMESYNRPISSGTFLGSSWRLPGSKVSQRCSMTCFGPSKAEDCELRARHVRFGPAGGAPGRQDSQGDEASGDPGGDELQNRVRHQSEGRKSPGTHDCPSDAVPGRSAHPLTPPDSRGGQRNEVVGGVEVVACWRREVAIGHRGKAQERLCHSVWRVILCNKERDRCIEWRNTREAY